MPATIHTGFGDLAKMRSPFAGHATVVEPTADPVEAIQRAGLDWTVSKRPLWFTGRGNKSKPVKVDGHFAVVRDSDEQMLGTVTGGYTPVQNVDAFAWAAGLGEFTFAGATRDGGQVYLGVKLDRALQLAGDDTDLTLVLWNGHDGKKSLGGLLTPIRVWCTNQLSSLMKGRADTVSTWFARHSLHVLDRAANEREQLLQAVGQEVDALQKLADDLAAIKVDSDMAKVLLEKAMPGRVRLIEDVLTNLAASDTIADDQRNTGWGLLQATTEFFEWKRPAATRESALQSTLDGVGARTTRALEQLLVPA